MQTPLKSVDFSVLSGIIRTTKKTSLGGLVFKEIYEKF